MTMRKWQELEFDSRVLELKTASIPGSVSLEHLTDVLQECKENGIQLVYWSPPEEVLVHDMLWFTGYCVSRTVALERELVQPKSHCPTLGHSRLPLSPSLVVKPVPKGPACRSLLELSFVAGRFSRFYTDPSLSSFQFHSLYSEWVNNSTMQLVADAVFAAYDGGEIVGFITIKMSNVPDTATIGLLAVMPHCQQKGIGGLLMDAAIAWAQAAGASCVEVSTQSDNTSALKFYHTSGFVQKSITPVYHIWLETSGPIAQNVPYFTGKEMLYLKDVVANRRIESCGAFSKLCQQWLQQNLQSGLVLLTASGTAALEEAAILCNLLPGDEVIMPSYTFVSTASAFVLRGATPVFVDVREDTLNIDETLIKSAITSKTRAVVVVHYAGVACEMDTIMDIAKQHNLIVIEDAAHAFLGTYKGRSLGTIGDFGCFSFHYTKNIVCGEGGALSVNTPQYCDRAHIVWEKGTNRFDFIQKRVDKYEWIDLGSSYVPSEINAAFLFAQLEEAKGINACRMRVSEAYFAFLQPLQKVGKLVVMPIGTFKSNGHIFWVKLSSASERDSLRTFMSSSAQVECYSHYVPLHLSPAGARCGRTCGGLENTVAAGRQLLRLPLWPHMSCTHVYIVIKQMYSYFKMPAPMFKSIVDFFLIKE